MHRPANTRSIAQIRPDLHERFMQVVARALAAPLSPLVAGSPVHVPDLVELEVWQR